MVTSPQTCYKTTWNTNAYQTYARAIKKGVPSKSSNHLSHQILRRLAMLHTLVSKTLASSRNFPQAFGLYVREGGLIVGGGREGDTREENQIHCKTALVRFVPLQRVLVFVVSAFPLLSCALLSRAPSLLYRAPAAQSFQSQRALPTDPVRLWIMAGVGMLERSV